MLLEEEKLNFVEYLLNNCFCRVTSTLVKADCGEKWSNVTTAKGAGSALMEYY